MESPPKPFLQRLLPLVREGVAVVAAILIAFAIDAWWDARGVARDTEEALVSLEAELRENRDLVDQAIQDDVDLVAAIDAMLGMDSEEVGWLAPDSANRLLVSLVEGTTFNPSEGAIRSVLSTGVLEEIEAPELRQAIAGLSGVMTDPIEEMDQMWMAWGRFVEHGIATGTFASFAALTQDIGPQTLSGGQLLSAWLGDQEFREIFANLGFSMESYRAELEVVGTEIERIRGLVLAEIAHYTKGR
jgi:hypothetical protein